MERIRLLLLGIITALVVACSTLESPPPKTFYLALNTSSPELTEVSTTALELTSEQMRADDRLIVDQVHGEELSNIFSATNAEEMVAALIEGLSPSSSSDEALVQALTRTVTLARTVKEPEALTVIVVSAGTADKTTLRRIHEVMAQGKTQITGLHLVGVAPSVRLPFSTAFQPVRAITKISSTSDEFTTQFNSQGY